MNVSENRCHKKAPPHGCAVERGVTPTCSPTTRVWRKGRWCSTESNGVFGTPTHLLKQFTHLG